MPSWVARVARSVTTTRARRAISSPDPKATTTSLGGSTSTTSENTGRSRSPVARTTPTAAAISSAVSGSSGW